MNISGFAASFSLNDDLIIHTNAIWSLMLQLVPYALWLFNSFEQKQPNIWPSYSVSMILNVFVCTPSIGIPRIASPPRQIYVAVVLNPSFWHDAYPVFENKNNVPSGCVSDTNPPNPDSSDPSKNSERDE